MTWHPTSVAQDGSGAAEPGANDATGDPKKNNPAPPPATGQGSAPGEPDPRLLYANERTFLAWIRTSLALVAAGLAVIELLPAFKWWAVGRSVGLPLIALGTWLAATAYRTLDANERAMRAGEALPRNHQVLVLAIGVARRGFRGSDPFRVQLMAPDGSVASQSGGARKRQRGRTDLAWARSALAFGGGRRGDAEGPCPHRKGAPGRRRDRHFRAAVAIVLLAGGYMLRRRRPEASPLEVSHARLGRHRRRRAAGDRHRSHEPVTVGQRAGRPRSGPA